MHILVPAVGFWLEHAGFKHNPAGMFADWNPEVNLPVGGRCFAVGSPPRSCDVARHRHPFEDVRKEVRDAYNINPASLPDRPAHHVDRHGPRGNWCGRNRVRGSRTRLRRLVRPYERIEVAALEAQGRTPLARRVDTTGNDNGYVCGLAMPNAVRDASCMIGGGNPCALQALGLPVYNFTDDDNPALG